MVMLRRSRTGRLPVKPPCGFCALRPSFASRFSHCRGSIIFSLEEGRAVLLQVERKRELKIEPIKHWLFRPFQGIGIGLLFGTKLLGILQLVAGPSVGSSLLIPEGHFQLGRLLLITLITVFVSLLLSTLWTLDDMGIRYFNRRDQELKMIGKYVGTVMPVILGFTV